MILHFAVECLLNYMNANVSQAIKPTIQNYDHKTVNVLDLFSIYIKGRTGFYF